MGYYRTVLLIGGSKNGKLIDVKYPHTTLTQMVRKSFDDEPYIEEYIQFGLLDSVFILSTMDKQKAVNILTELIFQGLQNG